MHSECNSMIGFDEAREVILTAVHKVPAEVVPLAAAAGRVLAEDIVADESLVPYSRSAMDGYALRAAETERAMPEKPVSLRVAGAVFAGQGEVALAPSAAIAISTGAPIPRGADAVVPHENVQRGDGIVLILAPVAAGNCVFPPGEDVRRGELLVRGGEVVQPATLGLLAFVGKAELRVYRRPRVNTVCTGNELVELTSTPDYGQIRNSNAVTLSALITECGGAARYCGAAPDDPEILGSILRSAREGGDMLITTGGASVGERDLVKGTLAKLGVEFHFRAVAVRPGKPMAFGTWGDVLVFVLPGNPAAAYVCFQEFVRPALLLLAGRLNTKLPVVHARLRGRAKFRPGRRYIMLAKLTVSDSGFEVTPLANQCSVLVRTSAEANALILFPEAATSLGGSKTVEVHVLDWGRVVADAPSSQGRSEEV